MAVRAGGCARLRAGRLQSIEREVRGQSGQHSCQRQVAGCHGERQQWVHFIESAHHDLSERTDRFDAAKLL
ncbi:hypothetical protein DF027_31830 [Burkholderia cenocepacia]|nr:hypothetical protein DF027_31830 [Burkholderia cenocepacia]RQV35911.1 hypothetical protein DF028_24665 [Burkholderia cenocepacia]RQV75514.1 hypothetical protein DF010_19810 [Burkholderia cenocepacia]